MISLDLPPLNLDEPNANIYNRDFYAFIHAPLNELMTRAATLASDGPAYSALAKQRKAEVMKLAP